MQKKISFITLCFLAVTLAFSAQAASDRFVEKDKGFSITLPKKWEIKKGVMGAEFIALRPKGGAKDNFRENVNVVVETLTEKMNPKDYFKASQGVLQKVFNEFKIEKSGHLTIDKHDVYWSIFTHKMGGIKAKVLQYMTVEGMRGYVITGSATPTTFAKYKKDFETVAMSLSLASAELVKK